METNENQTELIENYLLKGLHGPQLAEFERRLADDLTFQHEVVLQRDLVQSIKQSGINDLRAELKEIHQQVIQELEEKEATSNPRTLRTQQKSERKKSGLIFRTTRKTYWLTTASLVLLLLSTFIWYSQTEARKYEVAFESHFRPYPNIGYASQRGADRTGTPLMQAFEAYDRRDYAQSIPLFNQIYAKQGNNIALFYLGVAYLGSNQTQAGITALETYRSKYEELAPEANWYLSLAYLKTHQVGQAKKALKMLSKTDNDYREQAIALLHELN